ncbi:hypothetical protein LPJ61_003972, partial [Coemansia biformis]
ADACAVAVRAAMLTIYTDASLDRWRVESLLHNNCACVYATMFRQQWIRRLDPRLQQADVSGRGLDALRGCTADVQGLRPLFGSAMRSSDAALELSQLSIPAHYNRLLLAWDGARLDTMEFILELQPLLAGPAGMRPEEAGAGDGPMRSRLRAEFGDMAHRVREVHLKLRACWAVVRSEAASMRSLRQMMSETGRGCADPTTSYLVHSCEAFFGVSNKHAGELCQAAALVLALFERSSDLLAPGLPGDMDADDCASVVRGMARRWRALSAGMQADGVDGRPAENGPAMLNGGWFQSCGDSALEPSGYLWHRHLSYSESSASHVRLGLAGADVDELPVLFATDMCTSDTDDCDNAPLEGRQTPATGTAATGAERASPSPRVGTETAGASERDSSSDAQENHGWPRKTHELVPDVWSTESTPPSSSGDDQNADAARDFTRVVSERRPVPVVLPARRYKGHCSFQTIKDVNFVFGNYVASGSDDGCLFMWDRHTMDIVQIIRGDSEIVNIVEGHPALPMVAVSGIDSEVQIFHLAQGGPTAAHRRNFPVVRPTHTLAAGLRDAAACDACASVVYGADPYLHELERAGHSPLPPTFDADSFKQSLQLPFPAVSTSMLARVDQIARRNEDMRASGLAHSALTHQILSNLLLENGVASSDDESEISGMMDSDDYSGADDSSDGGASFGYGTDDEG